ncbi:hypothetical protein ACSEPW_01875 [Pseudomonas aeruginosa]
MTESKICTCPSGDGSLRWPCPAHPAEQAGGDERAAFKTAYLAEFDCDADGDDNMAHSNTAWRAWKMARAALAQPSPVRSSLLINGYQLRAALDFIAPDGTAEQLKSEACIEWRQQDADFLEAGLYAFCAEYPEEGGVLLDEEPTTAQPSPLQSEQAEAERPEVAEVAFVLRNIGAMDAEDIDGDNVDLRFEDAEGRDTGCDVSIVEYAEKAADLFEQHERIVGALRAEITQLRQHKNDYMDAGQETYRALQNEIREREAEIARLDGLVSGRTAERDAALAEVERLRESKGDPSGSFDRCMKMMYERDENAKRLDAALARVAELDKQCRDDVARALGLRPSQERGFAWSYLLASIKSCVKASEDAAQAQHSVPEVSGIGRDFAYPRSVVLYLRTEPTDDDLRAIHDGLRSLAAAPGKEGNDD